MTEHGERIHQSIWRASAELPRFDWLSADVEADVCVIGGGITGLTAALLLAREGRSVALIESRRLGAGVTGSTTAHLTSLVDVGYGTLAKSLGLGTARAVYSSTRAAIERVGSLVSELDARCDFERLPGCFYAEPDGDARAVRASAEALRSADVNVAQLLERSALPFATATALTIPDQATLHPLKYLAALARAAVAAGARVYEQTRAHHIHDGEPCVVETADGKKVRARHLFHATHTPLGVSLVQTEMTTCCSYVIAARVSEAMPAGLFFDSDKPYRYVRRHHLDGRELVLIGGADHKTGKGQPLEAIESLERYARERFDVLEIVARWSAQVFQSSDGLPYIGWSPLSPHSIVATGYGGDGMVFGTLAAMMGADLIAGRRNAWSELYKPNRFHPAASAGAVVAKNLGVARDFFVDRLKQADARVLDEVPRGEGRIVRLDGRQLAVYRDPSGELSTCSATCPHMRCIVHWNVFERTWDCPCHGSRFDATGSVLEGPSTHDLHKVDVPSERG